MAGIYLLDTNSAIALSAGDAALLTRIQDAEEVFVPAIVLGELYFGAQKSSRMQENLRRVDTLAAGWAVLNCDRLTARHYGRIKQQLRAKGRPIPDNDIWIAAVALQHGLPLLTRDRHFSEVDDLTVEAW